MRFIVPLNITGSHIVISDTKESCFVCSLQYLQKDGFMILGLKKTAEGNSHDENWQDKYTVIGDGGDFKALFERENSRLTGIYEDSPIVEHIESLTEEEMLRWSLPYAACNGESQHRYIYAVRDAKKYIFETESEYIQTPDKTRNYDRIEWGLRNTIRTLKVIGHRFSEQ